MSGAILEKYRNMTYGDPSTRSSDSLAQGDTQGQLVFR